MPLPYHILCRVVNPLFKIIHPSTRILLSHRHQILLSTINMLVRHYIHIHITTLDLHPHTLLLIWYLSQSLSRHRLNKLNLMRNALALAYILRVARGHLQCNVLRLDHHSLGLPRQDLVRNLIIVNLEPSLDWTRRDYVLRG